MRPVYVAGDEHAMNAPPSIEHANAAPCSDVKPKTAVGSPVVLLGPEEIVVSGGVVSIVHERLAGVGSATPPGDTARTRNVRMPSASPAYVAGDAQRANAEPSSEHWNVDPGSSLENVNAADVDDVGPAGPESMLVSGAPVSTVHVRCAGVGSALPSGSVAVTRNVCVPSSRSV